MTTFVELAAWANGFAERHGIDRQKFYLQPGMESAQDESAFAATSRIPARFPDAIADHPEVEQWIARILKQAVVDSAGKRVMPAIGTGRSLLILGVTGSGKSFQAYGAVRAFAAFGLRTGWRAVAAPDLYARLRPRHGVDSETEFRAVADAPLLIVDDLGAAKNSEWVEEVNYRLINHRYEAVLPTLLTSNVRPRDLAAELGDRVTSRLAEMADRVVLKGHDRRRAA